MTRSLSARVDDDMHRLMKAHCAATHQSMSRVIRELVAKYIKHPSKKK
jgi:Ribbon-helix-helix protein, copG family.